jgi:PAS domain S-box-containing protein
MIMNQLSKKLSDETKNEQLLKVELSANSDLNAEGNIVVHNVEEALQDSERKYRTLVENSQDGIFIIQDAKIQFANQSFARMVGYDVEDVTGEIFQKFVAPEDLEMVVDRYRRRQAGELVPSEYEFHMLHKDGKTRIVVNMNVGLITYCGRVASMGTVKDISERKQAEEKLLLFRNLINQSNEAIFVNDPETGRILDINNKGCSNLGYMREELLNMKVSDFEVNLHDDLSWKEYIKVLKTKGYLILEGRHRRKDGTTFPVEVNVSFIVLKKNSYMFAVVRDITERKKAEERLQASENKYRILLENLPQKIFCKDTKSVYISCNNNFARDLNINPEDIAGKSDFDFFPKELAEKYRQDDKRIMVSGKTEAIEEKYIQDGHERIVHTVKTPVKDGEGNIAYLLGIFWDITERKRAEEQIMQSLNEKEILLREIHHRVKNNLQIVSSLLAHQSQYTQDKNVIDTLTESQNRIMSMSLVHEKLYQSKNLAKIDINDYINDLICNIVQTYEVNGSKITLKMNIENIPLNIDFAIPCGLIINELITNSLKYAFSDRREGEVKVAFRSIDENMLELEVSDNGIGIPKDLDFRKTESLGLHLVTTLAENQLHGEINLNRSKGTEFKIKFRGIK